MKTRRAGRCEHIRTILRRVFRKLSLDYFNKNQFKENKLWTKKLMSKK